MSLSATVWAIRFFTVTALAALAGVVFLVDPDESGVFGEVLLFSALYASLGGLLVLGVVGAYRHFLGDETTGRFFGSAVRQGALVALLLTGLAALQFYGLLVWWDALLLVAGVLLLELSFRRLDEGVKE